MNLIFPATIFMSIILLGCDCKNPNPFPDQSSVNLEEHIPGTSIVKVFDRRSIISPFGKFIVIHAQTRNGLFVKKAFNNHSRIPYEIGQEYRVDISDWKAN